MNAKQFRKMKIKAAETSKETLSYFIEEAIDLKDMLSDPKENISNIEVLIGRASLAHDLANVATALRLREEIKDNDIDEISAECDKLIGFMLKHLEDYRSDVEKERYKNSLANKFFNELFS